MKAKNKKLASKTNDAILRLQAEMENMRKRFEAQKIEQISKANDKLISELLPILDNFKRAAAHSLDVADEATINWINGVKSIEKQFEDLLRQNGLEEISLSPGQTFDHNLHEAISHEASKFPEDTIIETVESGFKINGKTLRPAKVRVSSGQ